MEHPLVGNFDQYTDDELQEKINEINNKILMAYKMGNQQLIGQLQMALESFRAHQTQRNQKNQSDGDHKDKIDIS